MPKLTAATLLAAVRGQCERGLSALRVLPIVKLFKTSCRDVRLLLEGPAMAALVAQTADARLSEFYNAYATKPKSNIPNEHLAEGPESWSEVLRCFREGRPEEAPPDFNGWGFEPVAPCQHQPGSEGRVRTYMERYARREQLHHPDDIKFGAAADCHGGPGRSSPSRCRPSDIGLMP